MAQVNSTPGQNQVFGNAAVVPATFEVGATDTKTKATATIVKYNQTEPGRNGDTNINAIRS
jgi:hypothetical protein